MNRPNDDTTPEQDFRDELDWDQCGPEPEDDEDYVPEKVWVNCFEGEWL